MNIASIQGEANAIVASWLPGTEGEGVADTLFGLKPFTGRLPETWAKLVDDDDHAAERRRQELRPAVPVRLGPAHRLGCRARIHDRARRAR